MDLFITILVCFLAGAGAGKTTTLKAIMNMVHASGGNVEFFGLDMSKKEREIKKRADLFDKLSLIHI